MEANAGSDTRPFLSIITRTQGRRPHTLVEVLTCLTAQTDTDFELLILGHRLDNEGRAVVDRAIADTPRWMRERIRRIDVGDGNRTRPLNVGFGAATGEYIAVLDDDDAVFGHWVETFHDLARSHPGRVLRAMSALQSADTVSVQGVHGLRAEGAPEAVYPATFDFIDHMTQNRTPTIALAIPRQAFHALGVRYDESLTTTEDWDFFMRCISVKGIGNAPEITSIYRWWGAGESSRTMHDQSEWRANQTRISDKWNAAPFTIPAGGVRALLTKLEQHAAFRAELVRLRDSGAQLDASNDVLRETGLLRPAQEPLRVKDILTSTSWRITAPLRRVLTVLHVGDRFDYTVVESMSVEEAESMGIRPLRSMSWRITAPLRWLGALSSWYTKLVKK